MANTEPREKIYKSKKAIFIDNVVGGFGWAIGATIGLAIIVTLITVIMSNINLVPFVGTFVGSVLEFVLKNNPQLAK